MGYNLRSKRRCFLKNSLLEYKHLLPENSEPKVFLEVLDVLNTSESDRFYLKDGKIIPYESNRKKSSKFKVFWKILLTVMILIVISFVWKGFLPKFKLAFKKEINSPPITTVNVLDSLQPNFEMENEETFEKSDSREFVKELVAEYIAKKKKTWNKTEPVLGFIEEQCKMEPLPQLADNSFARKTEALDDYLFENVTDYALQSLGAKVVSTFETEPYGVVTLKFFKYNFGVLPNFLAQRFLSAKTPTSILETWQKPGDCWAFKGSRGRVQIQFSKRIIITAIAVEHIPKNFSDTFNLSSAPRKFSVIGLEDVDSHEGKILVGIFEYRASGPHHQVFSVKPRLDVYFNGVEVSIESNHGNKDYTCVYKIKIYGYE